MLKTKYGIDFADFDALLSSQDGRCVICQHELVYGLPKGSRPEEGQREAVVDHDHATGDVRGILCRQCNSGLGLLGDNVEALTAALSYLLSPSHQRLTLVTT